MNCSVHSKLKLSYLKVKGKGKDKVEPSTVHNVFMNTQKKCISESQKINPESAICAFRAT